MKVKYLLLAIAVGIGALVLLNIKNIKYGLHLASGQVSIVSNSVSVDDVLESPETTDSIKLKIEFIQDVKRFAENELGLKETNNYTTFYEQNNKPILWVVTASPLFKIEAYKWKFPIAGEFSYKGFFDYEDAELESFKLRMEGYDTQIDEVNAWSTLGWLNDPILSSMLNKSKPALADLIIHELTHSTIYLKDSVQLNENLASFIATKGTELYFQDKSQYRIEYEAYKRKSFDKRSFRARVKAYIQNLNVLYNSFDENVSFENKIEMKRQLMEAIKYDILSQKYNNDSFKIEERMKSFEINNAYFSGFNTYRAKEKSFEKEFTDKFNRNLKEFIEYYKRMN